MTILAQSVTVVNVVTEAGGLDMAHEWGKEDALNSTPRRPSRYFCFDTPQYAAYDAGYIAGVTQRVALTGVSETVWMNHGDLVVHPGNMPADFAAAVADLDAGLQYVPAGIDWAAVEDEVWG